MENSPIYALKEGAGYRIELAGLMDERGLSVRDLAESAKITNFTARMLRLGVTEFISFKVLTQVCDALGVEPGALFVRR